MFWDFFEKTWTHPTCVTWVSSQRKRPKRSYQWDIREAFWLDAQITSAASFWCWGAAALHYTRGTVPGVHSVLLRTTPQHPEHWETWGESHLCASVTPVMQSLSWSPRSISSNYIVSWGQHFPSQLYSMWVKCHFPLPSLPERLAACPHFHYSCFCLCNSQSCTLLHLPVVINCLRTPTSLPCLVGFRLHLLQLDRTLHLWFPNAILWNNPATLSLQLQRITWAMAKLSALIPRPSPSLKCGRSCAGDGSWRLDFQQTLGLLTSAGANLQLLLSHDLIHHLVISTTLL